MKAITTNYHGPSNTRMNTIAQPELLTSTFAVAVEASYDHMRRHHRTTRNQDDYDAGVKMLVELSKTHEYACGCFEPTDEKPRYYDHACGACYHSATNGKCW